MPEITRRTVRQDDKGGARGAAPLASLDPANNPFLFASLKYPQDIEKLSHAILFNINVQDKSRDITTEDSRSRTIAQREIVEVVTNSRGDVEAQRSRQQRTTTQISEFSMGLTKNTSRIKRAISLYVPDTVVFSDHQDYETPSLMDKYGFAGTLAASAFTAKPGTTIAAGLAALTAGVAVTASARVAEAAARVAAAASAIKLPNAAGAIKTLAPLFGYALNPVIEVLYNGPQLRKFEFTFVFAPKNAKEADDVWNIIYEFRRHAAPEIRFKGILLIPPSEFEITFLRKSYPNAQSTQIGGRGSGGGNFIENTNMPRISTCVLRNVTVDYASSGGFATFNDGMPVQISMRLDFQETQQLTREAIDKGY